MHLPWGWQKCRNSCTLPTDATSARCPQHAFSTPPTVDQMINGVVQVMGNSTGMWRAKYDINFHSREAQAAVDAMGTWRAAMLNTSRKRKASQVLDDSDSDSDGQADGVGSSPS